MDNDFLLGRLDPSVIAQVREEIREGKLKIGNGGGLPPPPRPQSPVTTTRSLEEQVIEAVRSDQPVIMELLRSLRREQNETLSRLAQEYECLRTELVDSLFSEPSKHETAREQLQLEASRLYDQVTQLIERSTERICREAPSLGGLLKRPAIPHCQHNRHVVQLVLINFDIL